MSVKQNAQVKGRSVNIEPAICNGHLCSHEDGVGGSGGWGGRRSGVEVGGAKRLGEAALSPGVPSCCGGGEGPTVFYLERFVFQVGLEELFFFCFGSKNP